VLELVVADDAVPELVPASWTVTPSGEPEPKGLNNVVPQVKSVGYSMPPAPLPNAGSTTVSVS
jgi:hypothetical protein